jgi:uncharacterized protein (DUF488 family)
MSRDALSIEAWIVYILLVVAASVTFTIGYSGRTLSEFVSTLRRAGVKRVVDVRALPLSRKKGFSKTALGEALSEAKIEYVHLREAGNPYRDQKANVAACLALYSAYVDGHPEVVQAVETAVDGKSAALLCFEANACDCHRSVLVDRLTARNPHRKVQHL